MDKLTAPSHLTEPTRDWWQAIYDEYELESHHAELLTGAAKMLDRATAAREIIDTEGAVYYDRFGQPKERPEVSIERNALITYSRLMREIGLDIEPEPPRAPTIQGANNG